MPDTAEGQPGRHTMAEMSADEKNAISHRGQAFRKLLAGLQQAGLLKQPASGLAPEA